jgi:hypothetical protein
VLHHLHELVCLLARPVRGLEQRAVLVIRVCEQRQALVELGKRVVLPLPGRSAVSEGNTHRKAGDVVRGFITRLGAAAGCAAGNLVRAAFDKRWQRYLHALFLPVLQLKVWPRARCEVFPLPLDLP